MGSSVSTNSEDQEGVNRSLSVLSSASRSSLEDQMNSMTSMGVGQLFRDIGWAMLPLNLKHSYESIMQVLGK